MIFEIIAFLLVVYVLLSHILLRNPSLLHNVKINCMNVAVIGHRGGCGECIENTIDAFRNAVSLGCDKLELDCQLTKDKQVVISHDNDLIRGTGQPQLISETDFNQLPEYLDTVPVTFGFDQVCKAKPGVSRVIPLLRTVFEEFPTVPINIDVKVDNNELIQKISDLVTEFKREEITVWGSFLDCVNAKCLKLNPKIATFFPIKCVIFTMAAYYVGLLPFLPIKNSFFEVPLVKNFGRMNNVIEYIKKWTACIPTFLKLGLTDDDILKYLIELGHRLMMSPKLLRHFQARGIPVYFWVLNCESDFDEAYSLGVPIGIVTDYVSVLMAYLAKHPELPRGAFSSKVLSSSNR